MTEPEPKSAMLQMDGIRLATLAVLAVDTLVVVLLAVFLVTNVQAQRQTNECYQNLLNEAVTYLATASQAGRTDRQAQRELLTTQAATPEERRAALDRYLAQLDEADRTRSVNPIPTQRCAR
jgi:FMN-dependent NADH-azoreductase